MPLEKSEYVSSVWRDGLFKDKVVFCTGGNGTICSAQVRALVHLGANACIVGRNVDKTESMAKDIATARPGARVIGLGAIDVRSVESLEQAVATCVKELGGIDFLIAGAAGNFLSPIHGLSTNAFKTVMDIDVLGSYNTLKAALPHLLESARKNPHPTSTPSGRVVFVSATLHYTGVPLQAHVGVAKAGVDALSVATAIEFGPLGLTSNVIAPGPIANTEGMDRLAKKVVENDPNPPWKRVPVGRWGSVKDIADATVYLFSDTGDFVNGSVIVVDGGSWRTGQGAGTDFKYPDFLLSKEDVTGVAGLKKSKSKL